MYISTHHITIRFNGSLNYYFAFDIRHTEAESWDCTIPNADIERIFKVKEDGYLYIQGCRITNNKDGIRTVYLMWLLIICRITLLLYDLFDCL